MSGASVRAGYKRTEVGVIPEEWEVKSVRDLAQVKTGPFGTLLKAHEYSGSDGVPLISVGEIGPGAFRVNEHTPLVPEAVVRRLPQYVLRYGDIVFARKGSVERSARVTENEDGWFLGSDGISIRPQRTCHPPYLSWQLQRHEIQAWLVQNATGTTMASLNQVILNRVIFPYAPLPEQRAIAAALSDVDVLITGLDHLISKKRDLKQAAMQQLLTGQIRLEGFGPTNGFKRVENRKIPKDWEVKSLKSLSSMNGRIGWQGLKFEEFTNSFNDPFLITGMNFKDGKIKWDEVYHIPLKRYNEAPAIQLNINDLLMTKDGTIGKLLYVDTIPYPYKASLNSHLLVLKPIDNAYIPKYLYYQMSSALFLEHIESNKSGSTFFGLTQEATGKYNVILPSIPEQSAIATVLSDMDAELTTLESRLDKTRDLKQGMMQELLTGRIRLV